MLTNTRATFDKIFMDFKRFSYYLSIFFNCVYILSMVYALFSGTGMLYIKIPLLVGAVVYFFFYIFTYWKKEKGREKKAAKKVYRWFKILMNFVTLLITVYGIYVATEKVNVISVLLAVASVISWLFEITTALIIEFIDSRKKMILAAIAMDLEPVTKPVNAVGNTVRKIVGKEPQEPKTVSEVMEHRINKIRESFVEKRKLKKSKTPENK